MRRPRVESDGTSVVMSLVVPIYNRSFEPPTAWLPAALRFTEVAIEAGGKVAIRFWKEDAEGPSYYQGLYGRRSGREGLTWARFESMNLRGVKKLELKTDEATCAAGC